MIVMPFTVAYASGGDDTYDFEVHDSGSLRDAIRDASNGQTIYLKDGRYKGTFSIEDKALTLVGESRDGVVLQFDPAYKQTKTFNGGSCYPILFSDSDLTVKNLTVKGPTNQHHGIDGILAEADLIMDSVTVQDIRCTADGGSVCGVQYGKGILVEGSGAVSITNCSVIDFQKTAIDLNTTGEVVIDQNVIEGVGPQAIIAQNGIVIRKGSATITGNKISDLSYTADNEWKYGSTGIYPLEGVTALTVTGNMLEAVDDPIYTGALTDDVKDKADISGNIIEKLPAPFAVDGSLYATLAEAVEKASDGDIITIAEGIHEIGSVRISKCVSIKGAGAGKTILNGSMDYTGSSNGATVPVSNLTMQATAATSNHGLNFGALQNSAINVKDCAFTGYEFAIGVNSTATGNTLIVSGTTFTSTGCAVGVKAGTSRNRVVFGENVVVKDGYAIQAFGAYENTASGYGFNAYYETYDNYVEDAKDDKFDNPDYDALNDSTGSKTIIVTPSMDLNAAIAKANDGDTLQFTSGTFDLSSLNAITKRVNLVGAGEDETVFQGHVTYQFSEDQEGNTVSVSGIKFEAAAADKVQGLQFRGDKPNNGYNLNIEVEDCTFDGWNFGVTMNSHANGYAMTVSGCDFSTSMYAVSYNFDTETEGQIADNSLSFGEGNIISADGYAVQKFNNDPSDVQDLTYQTIEDFENDRPCAKENTIVSSNGKTYSSDELGKALSELPAGGTLYLGKGTFAADAMEQLLICSAQSGVTIRGQGDATVIDAGSYSVDGQAGFYVGADNVTIENLKIISASSDPNVAAVKFSYRDLPYRVLQGGTLRNVTLSSNLGHGANIHGVDGMLLDGVTVEKTGKLSISVANSSEVTVRNTATAAGGWGSDIGIMYTEGGVAYQNVSHVILGSGNDFANNGTFYSEYTGNEIGSSQGQFTSEEEDGMVYRLPDEQLGKYVYTTRIPRAVLLRSGQDPLYFGELNDKNLIDALEAAEDGDVIEVAGDPPAGSYTITVNKAVTIRGRDDSAIIGDLIIAADGVKIEHTDLSEVDVQVADGISTADLSHNYWGGEPVELDGVEVYPYHSTPEMQPDDLVEEPDDKPSGGSSSDDSSVGSPLPTVPTEPGEPTDPTDPSTPSGFVSDTTNDLTVNGTYQFRITSLDGTIPFLTVDNANFRVEFASQEGNDFFFKIHAQGAAGSTTVVSVNGVRLLTATVGGSATGVISDTTAPFTVKKGEMYQFRLTASERPSFAAGSASFTVEYAGQIGSDYFYKVYAAGNVGDGCGFYINGEASPVAVATIA